MAKQKKSSLIDKRYISVRGARQHNLKNVNVDIPRNKLTVITGVSGSGKSSLAFDTIYAEGQRRFVESLSSYVRQFLERMEKPNVESIEGLPPAVAIGQNTLQKNPRSTVGTNTEIYDYLRVLYARIGTAICQYCGREVRSDNPASVIKQIARFEESDKLLVLFPFVRQKESMQDDIDYYSGQGYFRLYFADSDTILNLEEEKINKKSTLKNVYVVADRIKMSSDNETISRITESIEAAFKLGDGRMAIKNLDKSEFIKFSKNFECADCNNQFEELNPRIFSFNNPQGACPKCQGFGRTLDIDEELVFPNKSKSILEGAIVPFNTEVMSKFKRLLIKIAPEHKLRVNVPISELSDSEIELIWEGADDYIGLNGFFKMLEENSYKIQYRVLLNHYKTVVNCRFCKGSRLRTSARQVFIQGKNIPELISMPLNHLLEFMKNIQLTEYQFEIASPLLKEIVWRLKLLVEIGLEYLTLSRLSHTLSGGESQRINLSTALGSSLVGTLYVLDEPSIGMHPRDTEKLIKILYKLRNLGNTVIVVEHDPDLIKVADYIIDMGPKAGEGGGELIFAGDYKNLLKCENSLTAQYFSGRKQIELTRNKNYKLTDYIRLQKVTENNLAIEDLKIPLDSMVVITGVSGSGKSTLINDVLYPALKKFYGTFSGYIGKYESITSSKQLQKIEMVDQSPIGRSSRSTPATYTKVFDYIRELFEKQPAAKNLGWRSGYFSFNVPGGRCETCEGEGYVTVNMQFLPDVSLICETCKGTRYKKEINNVLIKSKSIVDVLNMTVDEAVDFFQSYRKIYSKLKVLQDVGLGYVKLGQPSSMLSGGESQRVKMAMYLDSSESENGLYIFDEPTTGLHIDDISKLVTCFRNLLKMGNSLIIIEHNLHIISNADWIIDLGPEAGEKGGTIVATGNVAGICNNENSFTGQALKQFFIDKNIEIDEEPITNIDSIIKHIPLILRDRKDVEIELAKRGAIVKPIEKTIEKEVVDNQISLMDIYTDFD